MTDSRRHNLVIALIAALVGGGIGLEAMQRGLTPAASFGMWVAAFGGLALLIVLLAEPAPTSTTAATSPSGDEAGWAEFRREMRRARRGVRPLTLVRVPGPGPDDAGSTVDLTAQSLQFSQHLRLVDRTWVDDGSVYVLLPESPRAAADILLGRLRATAPDLLAVGVRIATFPDDGLTSGAIIAAVHGSAAGDGPTPIRSTLGEDTEVATYAIADEQPIGETAARS